MTDPHYVGVKGIWLRRIGDEVQVLAESEAGWHLVLTESIDGYFSHIVEPSAIAAAPLDKLNDEPEPLRDRAGNPLPGHRPDDGGDALRPPPGTFDT